MTGNISSTFTHIGWIKTHSEVIENSRNFKFSIKFWLEIYPYVIKEVFEKKMILRVVAPDSSFEIAYCDISALQHAYALKIRL